MSVESKRVPPNHLKTYEAIQRYYGWALTQKPEGFPQVLEALKHAGGIEPECGQVWTILDRLYGQIYSLELPGFENTLGKTVTYAEKGVQLNPENQQARGVMAFIRMLCNEIPTALSELEHALALNPNSLFMLDSIGCFMTLLGEWERGPALIRKVIKLNPYYANYVHYALWVNWIRQEKYEEAYLETQNLKTPALFWDHLAKAASLGQLGRYEKGKRAVEDLLKLKPDFPRRGRVLIGHYIKFGEGFRLLL